MAQSWDEARNDVLSRLDFRSTYEEYGIANWTNQNRSGNVSAKCPLHDDKQASLSVNLDEGTFKCFADCPATAGGSVFDWVMIQSGVNFNEAFRILAAKAGVAVPEVKPEIPQELPAEYRGRLTSNRRKMKWLAENRGLHKNTVERFRIGWDGQRITIPVYDEFNRLKNIRRYKPGAKGKTPKFQNFVLDGVRYGSVRIFNLASIVAIDADQPLIWCEGEMDCMLLVQEGFVAVTGTGGAGSFKPEWVKWFKGRKVTIVLDNDAAGKTASEKIAALLYHADIEAKVARLPNTVGDKGDITDFFVALGGTAESFREVVLAPAVQWLPQLPADEVEAPEAEVTLPQSSDAIYMGKRVVVRVMVSGKDTTPYVVPKKMEARCPVDDRKACQYCGMATRGGRLDAEFGARDRELIGFTQASDADILNTIKEKWGIAKKCDAFNVTFTNQNIEELRVIPELDYFHQHSMEEEYVVRNALFMGQGLIANRSYEMHCYGQSDPRNQYSTLVVSNAIPSQDSISSFKMNDELAEELQIFVPETDDAEGVTAKFREIGVDLEANVHQIFNRYEMQTALDLVWHSVIGFNFADKSIRKGWVEALVMGDSGQGKTEMSLCLLQHYGVGERVQGEQVSLAGLVGGVEQTQKRWMLSWGKMPLNDRRLLVMEEVSGMSTDDLAKLSDIRSTGVAEITKMRTERTNARCRLIFLSNARSGRPLRTYDHGVRTILELFGNAEDVRRLDFAIVVASGEVPLEVLNQTEKPNVVHVFKRHLCKSLILWAWSRKPDQVHFTKMAHEAIVEASMDFATTYSSKIPLVEPADMKIKLARLSAATAARVFSTGETTEILKVDAKHVSFIVSYLREQYEKETMAYGEYSQIADHGERISEEDREAFIKTFKSIGRWRDLVKFFQKHRRFRRGDIVDAAGWAREDARVNFRILTTELACIRSTTNGFIKEPFFIPILRELAETIKNVPLEREVVQTEVEENGDAEPF